MIYQLLKVPFLLALWACHYLAFGRPDGPPPSDDEREGYKQAGDSLPSFVPGLGRDLYTLFLQSLAFSELYIIVCGRYPDLAQRRILGLLMPNGATSTSIRMNPIFIVGFVLTVSGTAIRVNCLRQLGKNFTLQLSIRRDHALCTNGLYSIVRHPSYAAAIPYAIGISLCHFTGGSWWVECGASRTALGGVVGFGLVAWHLLVITSLMKRTKTEDEVLKKTFGQEWVQWAQKTPYAMFPYIF